MFRVQILIPCSTNIWKIGMKNSITNWFNSSFIYITTKFTRHGIFKFRSKSSCFFFLLKIMTSVLATLKKILFTCSHWIRNLRSLLTTLFIFLIDSLMLNRQVSSAKWKISEFFIAILRSLIKIKKSNGSRTKPWGTPYFTVCNQSWNYW